MNLRKCRKSYDDTCDCPNCKNWVMNKDKLDLLVWKLTELAYTNTDDIKSGELEIFGEDESGRDAYYTVSISEIAQEALEAIDNLRGK